MERRLGRGLESLLGSNSRILGKQGAPQEPKVEPSSVLPTDQIEPNPYQPRRTFDPLGLAELESSIREHGILQPVVVRPNGDKWQLIAGERRWRAAKAAGMTEIPARVMEGIDDRGMLELALVENIQRRDLDAIEKAEGYREMMRRLGLSQEKVAERVGLKRSSVANQLRLLELPQKAQEAVSKGLVSMGHARALLPLKSQAEILSAVDRIVREGLSVRQVEQYVRRTANGVSRGTGSEGPELDSAPPWVKELETRMREQLGTRVRIENGPGFRGKITIDYFDRDELDRLCLVLAPRRQV